MDKDRFDILMIEFERKQFELNMEMALFVSDILQTFKNNCTEVGCVIAFCNAQGEYSILEAAKIFFNRETCEIEVYARGNDKPFFWDELDFSSKYIIMNEIHHRYKSNKIYTGLSDKGMH